MEFVKIAVVQCGRDSILEENFAVSRASGDHLFVWLVPSKKRNFPRDLEKIAIKFKRILSSWQKYVSIFDKFAMDAS